MSGKFERVFDLSVDLDRTWKSFTDPRELEAWWAPKVIAFEARPGGRVKYSITGFGEHEGEVLEVRPRQFLRFREGPGHIPGTTEVAVTFEATTRIPPSRNCAGPDVPTHAQARQGQHEAHRHHQCAIGDRLLHSSGVPDPNGANESGTVVGGNVRTSRPFE